MKCKNFQSCGMFISSYVQWNCIVFDYIAWYCIVCIVFDCIAILHGISLYFIVHMFICSYAHMLICSYVCGILCLFTVMSCHVYGSAPCSSPCLLRL